MLKNSHRFARGIGLVLLGCLSLLLGAPASRAQGALTLEDVLKNLDTAAKQFHSVSASIERTKFTAVVKDYSTDSGQMQMRRDRMRIDLTSPSPRTVILDGAHLYVYTPGLKRVEEYDLGKHRAQFEQFLLVGFGTSASDLKKDFDLSLKGEETLNGRKTVRLELVPKSEDAKKQFSRIDLWLEEGTWLPVQQQLFETGSEDYSLVRYSNIMRNVSISDTRFQPHWPSGVTIEKPQS